MERPAQGRLRLLYGDSETCPTGQMLGDADLVELSGMLKSPTSDGILHGVDVRTLPPRHRIAALVAQRWFSEWRDSIEERTDGDQ